MFLITFQRASVATLVGGLAFTTIPALSQEGAGKIKESDPNAQVSAPLKPVRNEAKPPQAGENGRKGSGRKEGRRRWSRETRHSAERAAQGGEHGMGAGL